MKISLSLISVGMIAAAASAGTRVDQDIVGTLQAKQDVTGNMSRYAQMQQKRAEAEDTLFSTDFNDYTIGAVCTDLTGATAGQGGWYQFNATATTTNNAFAIQAGTGTNSANKNLKTSWGSSAATGGTNYLYQDNAGSGYVGFTSGRTSETNFSATRFSNTVTGNKGFVTQYAFTTSTTAGVAVGLRLAAGMVNTSTAASITGLAYLNVGGAVGFYGFTLATGSATTSYGVSHNYYSAYDAVTGAVYWGWDIGLATETNYFYAETDVAEGAVIAGLDVFEFDFLSSRNSSTTTGNMQLDNIGMFAYDVPAPGAAALLGLAGIVARRRRN
jgi:hypothetical protein